MPATEARKVPRPLGDLRGPWILFVDDHCVAEMINVKRTLHAFVRHDGNPLVKSGYVYGRCNARPNAGAVGSQRMNRKLRMLNLCSART